MNRRRLLALGVPEDLVNDARRCGQRAAEALGFKRKDIELALTAVLEEPTAYRDDQCFGLLAEGLLADQDAAHELKDKGPAPYAQWGENLDDNAIRQMNDACSVPVSVAGALMPDCHLGYGLPIGGVLATEGAVIPYAVGVDIACRMRLSITDLAPEQIEDDRGQHFERSLKKGTRFGTGVGWKNRQSHDVLDHDWSVSPVTNDNKDLAWKQLGTSGSGNHFVEWGILDLPEDDLGLKAGQYVALLSHSGSRGAGARVCGHYSRVAKDRLPKKYKQFDRLAWLSLDTQEGQEYWNAMNLMGEYAAANHAVIHRNVLREAGAQALSTVENHHNFAWKEEHQGRELIVHRKGATPAGEGVLGIIPGSMSTPGFVVRGKGHPDSLNSASHGAGRQMSRTQAKKEFTWGPWKKHLAEQGVKLLAAGIDEVPGVYKDIHQVMDAQTDLVDRIGAFQPRVVMMCGDNSKPED